MTFLHPLLDVVTIKFVAEYLLLRSLQCTLYAKISFSVLLSPSLTVYQVEHFHNFRVRLLISEILPQLQSPLSSSPLSLLKQLHACLLNYGESYFAVPSKYIVMLDLILSI